MPLNEINRAKHFPHTNVILNPVVTGKYYCIRDLIIILSVVVQLSIKQYTCSMYLYHQVFLVSFHSVSDFLMGDQDMVLSESTMSKQYSRVRKLSMFN